MPCMTYRSLVTLCVLVTCLLTRPTRAEIPKADRIFMKRGVFLQALCFPDNVMHVETLKECGFTGDTWPGKSNMKQLGPPPGIPWCRWLMKDDEFDITPEEKPYESNLVALQFQGGRGNQGRRPPAATEIERCPPQAPLGAHRIY